MGNKASAFKSENHNISLKCSNCWNNMCSKEIHEMPLPMMNYTQTADERGEWRHGQSQKVICILIEMKTKLILRTNVVWL